MEFHYKVSIRQPQSSKGSVTYRCNIRSGKTRLPGGKSFKSREAAQEWGQEQCVLLKHQATDSPVRPRGVGKSFHDLVALYKNSPSEQDVPGGKDQSLQHLRDVDWWCARLGQYSVGDIDGEMVRQVLNDFTSTPKSRWDAGLRQIVSVPGQFPKPATRNRKLAAVRRVFTFGVRRQWLNSSPAHEVGNLSERNQIARGLTPDQLARLLEACKESTWERLWLYVYTLATTGARRSEVLNLRWTNVDLDRGIAFVPVTKNGDPKVLVLTPIVVEEMRKCRGNGTALVFPSRKNPHTPFSMRKPWERAVAAAELEYPQGPHKPRLRTHDLRHTVAVNMAGNGATIKEIGAVLGHRAGGSTERYTQFQPHQASEIAARWVKDV